FTLTEPLTSVPFPKTPQISSPELMPYLTNPFGRPFIKAYVVSIELRLTNRLLSDHGEAILCVATSSSGKATVPFVEFMNDRMRMLSMALDRVLLENQLSSFSYRWEKTFDGMRDPIAIVDLEFQIVRANRKFSDRFLQHKCYESFAGRTEKCVGCP